MADLSNIFGGPWSPPPEKIVASPEQQLIDAMFSIGLTPPEQILMDGKIHRFKSGTKGSGGHGDKPGWYLIFGDGIPAGRFGCWRMGVGWAMVHFGGTRRVRLLTGDRTTWNW